MISMQENIQIKSSNANMLAGVLHRPDAGSPSAYALFAHCFTCTKNIRAAVIIAESLCAEGIAVLRFDFTGLGESGGDFADTHFSSNVQDLVDVADFMAAQWQAPQILVGHSLGGTAVLAAAHRIGAARAVATIGSPADAEHVLHLLEEDVDNIEQQGEASVRLAGRPFRIRKDFLDDIRSQSVRDGIRGLRKALLVMHSPVDELVSVEEAANIYSSALHPKSFISLDDADHLLSNKRDSIYAGHVLAAWASRYIDRTGADLRASPYLPGSVTVSGKAGDNFLVSINADGHVIKGDEPERYGGTDSGSTPYDLLSAALGSCTVMTLNMYARRKKLPLESVRMEIRHGKIHVKDCEHCESDSGRVDRFDCVIHLEGELDSAQRSRLLEIAGRCPVHKTLHSEVDIRSRLAD
jgi:putative redox protein